MAVLIGEHCHGADTSRRMDEEEDGGGCGLRRIGEVVVDGVAARVVMAVFAS